MKERFLVNPFRELNLTPADASLLEDLANQCITSNLEHYTKFISSKKRVVDLNRWKLIKEGHKLKVYSERAGQKPSAADIELTGEVTSMSAVDVARARIVAQKSIGERSSFIGALSSSNSAGDSSYSS
ncbi:hypothetical protein PF002_g24505 [Phytophthora fragariae]|uniref:Uncharacterized protein n=1 Tax=Phytophthora fragariae TaxID=53985 RepID=A0A6A3WVE5_9STRA|nr:hypothetical protein PF002_g24505 [Phytophthora fragariae]